MHMCLEYKDNHEKKITKLEFVLNASKDTLKKFNVGSKALDKIISVQKYSSNKRGLGYIDKPSSPLQPANKDIFVKPKKCDSNLPRADQTKESLGKTAQVLR